MKNHSKTLAIATAAGAATSASAAIIHLDLSESPVSATGAGIFFSLSDQWVSNLNLSESFGGEFFGGEFFGLYFYDTLRAKPVFHNGYGSSSSSVATDGGLLAKNFAAGSLISGSETFLNQFLYINSGGNNDANWAAGTRGFLGLRFNNSGTPNFGWADLEYSSDNSLILYGFAYDDSGAPIEAGAIPEPGAAALLAALAAGSVALLNRRRRAASADAGA